MKLTQQVTNSADNSKKGTLQPIQLYFLSAEQKLKWRAELNVTVCENVMLSYAIAFRWADACLASPESNLPVRLFKEYILSFVRSFCFHNCVTLSIWHILKRILALQGLLIGNFYCSLILYRFYLYYFTLWRKIWSVLHFKRIASLIQL